jgi:hypothetical protein
VLAGVLSVVGDELEFLRGQAGGYAASTLSQAYPLVTSIVGVLVFGESLGCAWSTRAALFVQYGLYIAAVALLGLSARSRPGVV